MIEAKRGAVDVKRGVSGGKERRLPRGRHLIAVYRKKGAVSPFAIRKTELSAPAYAKARGRAVPDRIYEALAVTAFIRKRAATSVWLRRCS